jgi:hypothetical protein
MMKLQRCAISICLFGAFTSAGIVPTVAQTSSDDGSAPPIEEEIIVQGRSRTVLREQIRLAEEAVYDRFNEINSNDEFDIHCYNEALTGSRMLRRVCRANFWRDAESRAGRETVRALQGSGFTIDGKVFQAEAMYKSNLLADEMRRLVREDEQLLSAVRRLANLELAIAGPNADKELLQRMDTQSRAHSAEDAELPYGAAIAADVRMGRMPWTHALTHPTFTIANVFGEITALRLICSDESEQLEHEAGVEWTLPEGWASCSVAVEAPSGTAFTLYEFD